METYIKLYRKIIDWEWYTDIPTKTLFIHILLKASATGRKYRGEDIPVGSFTTSIGILSEETGLSAMQIRTALNKLKSTGEIEVKTTNKFTQVFVIKWRDYQSFIEDDNKQVTNEQQTNNKQITTIKESKECKEYKKEKIYKKEKSEKHKHGEYQNVLLTDEEYDKLHKDYPNASELIRYLDEYIEMKGYKAKSHNLAIRKWVIDAVARENRNKPVQEETSNPFLKLLAEEQ